MSTSQQVAEIRSIVEALRSTVENVVRPADQVILDDVELRNYLKVSKRTTAYWREKSLITFSKLGGKIYYRLSDVLSFLKKYEIQAIASNIKIAI